MGVLLLLLLLIPTPTGDTALFLCMGEREKGEIVKGEKSVLGAIGDTIFP
jgi:hypothetical protein